jgi:poly(A) polymerase
MRGKRQMKIRGEILRSDARAHEAIGVCRILRENGHEAYLVGGCVRDLLLHRVPSDYDVATDAKPDLVMQLFPKTFPVGAKFGVILVLTKNFEIEVATFRQESGYSDSRRPDCVEFSDAIHDARRRDFTINGLYLDPENLQILDYVNGISDLQAKLIRAIGNPKHRFNEDALRILRALRFASSLGFDIEQETFEAVCELYTRVREISIERVRDELIKGFTRHHPDLFLDLLDRSGMLQLLLPEVTAMKGCEQPPQFHPEGDVFVHTRMMLSLLPDNPTPALAFATLLHDVGKPPTFEVRDRIRFNNHDKVGAEMADRICRRLLFPNVLREQITAMVSRHMNFMNLPRMKESTLRRFLSADTIEDEIELHRLDCLSSHGGIENYHLAREKLQEVRAEEPKGKLPQPLVTGYDLIERGLKPGPRFKEILNHVQDAQLEKQVSTRDDALHMLDRILKEMVE